jgi:hypothetical protein
MVESSSRSRRSCTGERDDSGGGLARSDQETRLKSSLDEAGAEPLH